MDGGDVVFTEKKTYTEVFEEQCPYFMSIGMTYEEYWYKEPERVKPYREAHLLKCKMRNQEMWVQGIYFISAIQAAMDKKAKYPKEPLELYEKTETEKKAIAEKERRKVIDYFTNLKKRWDNGTSRQPDS